MRDILRRYQPTRIEDLTALNALYRPGPIQGGMIDDFINRKHGKKKVAFDLPQLKDILEETYGVILYQEQVMQIANRLASFSLGEADILRRAMGKKKKEEMAAQRAKFMTGCAGNKIPEKKADGIFNLMEEFAGYGFNKSHSCAYALLAYQTAYLKTHFPVEFIAALLTSETGNADKAVKYINEARGMSIKILPPDVNESDLYFTPIGEAIRFGLAAIKNVGENTAKAICEARASGGRFKSLYDFCERIEVKFLNKRVFESLIKSGAMDSMGARESMVASIDDAVAAIQRAARIKESGQGGFFFGGAGEPTHVEFEMRDAAPWSEEERLSSEYAMLGFYVSGHPLEKYASRLAEMKAVCLSEIEGHAQRQGNHRCGVDCGDAADAVEEGRALGDLYDSGYDGDSGVAGVPGGVWEAGKHAEAARAVADEGESAGGRGGDAAVAARSAVDGRHGRIEEGGAGTDSHESGKYGWRSGGSASGYICDVSWAKSGGI